MFGDQDQDLAIAWPSYVDFLSAFIFVLIIFIGSLLYLLSGHLGEQAFLHSIGKTRAALDVANISYQVQGRKLYISLKDQVKFETGCPNPAKAGCAVNLTVVNQANLHKVAGIIAGNPGWNRIVIEGRADATPYRDPHTGAIDDFGNFELSSRRAMQVLRFLYDCADCGYDRVAVRPKLVLSGLGSRRETGADQGERRVDLVLDYSDGLK